MDDTTKLLLQIVQDIAEMKTDIRNMKDKMDEADNKCKDCETAIRLNEHLNEKNNRWKEITFWLPFLVSIGAVVVALLAL